MPDHNIRLLTGNFSAGTCMSKKRITTFLFIFFLISTSGIFAQDQKKADSLALIYQPNTLSDTAKLELLQHLSFNETRDLKKGLDYAEELINLSEQSRNKKYLRIGYFLKGNKHKSRSNLAEALAAFFKSAEIARETHNLTAEGECYIAIADTYSSGKNSTNAMNYYNKAIITLRQTNDSNSLASALLNVGDEFLNIKLYDSALLYCEEAKLMFDKTDYRAGKAYSRGNIGMAYAGIGKNDLAEKNLTEAIRILEIDQNYSPICTYLISMADVYLDKGDDERALTYAHRSLQLAEQYEQKAEVAAASLKLSELYEKAGDKNEAFKYYKNHIAYRDSVIDKNTIKEMADLRTNFEVSQKQIELNQQKQKQKFLVISLGIILGLTLIILVIILKNNQNKQKAYKILNFQKQKTDEQKAKAEDALAELQVTQKQLIQSAKMASLGELTAGIAHEIQNPLNFVNNFSEVSVELLGELRDGTVNKLTVSDKAEVDEIINNLTENLKKITDHGKRADSIVKGMLQHSRTSTGTKEATDINGLADEYLRLSYHGLRAKDKEFNANFTTNFDESIGKVEVIPQDLGRVLLNLYNNAFYAVNKKKNVSAGSTGQHYEPTVSVTTKRIGNKVELSIKDNGIGIPQEVLDKVFQPFFTTKPTGQGTGLGLSLSYDIIKAHGGDLKVETKEGEFAEFIIRLPIGSYNGTLM
jgi:signal transduction histidine kinase